LLDSGNSDIDNYYQYHNSTVRSQMIVAHYLLADDIYLEGSTGMTTGRDLHGRADRHDLRCVCGQLLAKWCADGIEVKCQGCKRIVMIPSSKIDGWATLQR
jgi:phage FluMu protein Com